MSESVQTQPFYLKKAKLKGIYLLNIYEIEALILADIDTFNEIYQTKIKTIQNVMEVIEPKEYLKMRAKNYVESQNPKIFELLQFEKVLNCTYSKNLL